MSLWDDALKDIHQFNALYAQVERKPLDLATLKRGVKITDKIMGIFPWAKKALTKEIYDALMGAWREIGKLAKTRDVTPDVLAGALKQFKDAVQLALDSTAPETFNYEGFKVSNEEHMADELCRKALGGVDFLVALFKRRDVPRVLREGVARIVLMPDAGSSAFFHSGTRELTLSVNELAQGKPGRFTDTFAGEAVLHEFGHYVHRNYITGEARDAWDAPWEEMPGPRDPKRQERLDPLEVVTEYGKTDKFEDFAETFMLFIAAPEKLTPTAKYRMQRALSLSGLYGKPVMRLASEAALVLRVVARAGR